MGEAVRTRPGWLVAARRTGVYFVLFTALGVIGRTVLTTDGRTALIWPAAGVAALWLGTAGRRWPTDAFGLAAATVLVNSLTGATPSTLVVLIVANVAGALAFVLWARASIGHLWGFGGADPLARLTDLGHLVVASLVGGLASAVAGWAGFAIIGSSGFSDLLVWWCRCSIGTLVVVSFAILVVQPVLSLGLGRWISTVRPPPGSRAVPRFVEAAALLVVTGLLTAATVSQPDLDSLVYLLVLTSVWAGLRFRPVLAMAHAMVLGWAVVIATVADRGPFTADAQSDTRQAMLSQGFLAVVALTALILALGRADLDRTSRALAAALDDVSARTALLDTVLLTMREGLTVVDEHGQVHLHNPSLAHLLGLRSDPPVVATTEQALDNLFHPDGRPVTFADLPATRALAGEEVAAAEFHVRSPEIAHGRIVEMGAQLLPGTGKEGLRRAVVNVRDVTADRQHRDALANFAGTVAHDLFTPLTMVNGWSETLVEAFESGQVDPGMGLVAAQRIHSSAQHMRDVIRDLLAYAVARDQSLHLETTDLSQLAEHLATLNRNAKSGPVITVQDGIVVYADRVLLRQLLENLIENAVKYAVPGVRPEISIRSRRLGDVVEIRVTDNGIGIELDEREDVFAPYHQIDDTGRGTGLGLAICRRIVDRHGGRIWIEDGPDGSGTSVVVTLPLGVGGGLLEDEVTETAESAESSVVPSVPETAA